MWHDTQIKQELLSITMIQACTIATSVAETSNEVEELCCLRYIDIGLLPTNISQHQNIFLDDHRKGSE